MVLAMVHLVVFSANDRREELQMRKINGAKIDSSINSFSDSAKITLPKNVKEFANQNLNNLIRRGDKVTIYLGYGTVLKKEFHGFVTEVSPQIPIVISCSDEMWQYMKLPVNVSYKNVMLADLMKDILPGITIDSLEIQLGQVRYAKTTVGAVLEKLKSEYNLVTYLKDGVIMCGKVYSANKKEVVYGFEQNIKSSNLKFKNKEDILIKLNATSTLSGGTKIEVTVGDEDGEQRNLSYFNIKTKAELEDIATQDLDKFKFTGFSGDFNSYGIPYAEVGWVANIASNESPEKDGKYLIESVITTFDDSPQFDRKITLERKAE